ncbi:hypothetical protein [Coleofasciculus sp. FACHB-SPT9]|uniref:hypothetical protein n=1 Tax=Coleofasciculus sp. FACHB-SPT9 TaxID=2692791 RepID=UPI00403F9C9F
MNGNWNSPSGNGWELLRISPYLLGKLIEWKHPFTLGNLEGVDAVMSLLAREIN